MVMEQKMKKLYDNKNDDNDDYEGQHKNFDQKSSLEPSAEVILTESKVCLHKDNPHWAFYQS